METLVDVAEHGVIGDEATVEEQFAMPAVEIFVERFDVTDQLESGVVGVNEKHGRSAAVARHTRGSGHADREARAVGAGDFLL